MTLIEKIANLADYHVLRDGTFDKESFMKDLKTILEDNNFKPVQK